MTLNTINKDLLSRLNAEGIKMGDIKKMAKEIKKDHELAMALWATEQFHPRMLAVLIMDKKLITQDLMNRLAADAQLHDMKQRRHITEWLLANQLMKDKKTIALLEGWEKEEQPILRYLFWYHQARLRWMGKNPLDNTVELLNSLETNMEHAEPLEQWAMNFTAGQIGKFEPDHRAQCIALGERLGLYKDLPVPRGCAPDYLPEFIRHEVAKLNA